MINGAGENDTHHMVLGNNNNHATFKQLTLNNVSQVVSLSTSTCLLMSDGKVYCGGRSPKGEIPDGNTADHYVYLSWFDTGLSNIVELVGSPTSLSYGSFLARKSDGTIYAWGHNDSGKLGTGNTTNLYTPTVIFASGSNIIQIATGQNFSCFLYNTGSVKCLGSGSNGRLGNNSTADSLTLVDTGLTNVVKIAAGSNYMFAQTSDPHMYSWGYNANGQLGDGTTTERTVPTRISVLDNATVIEPSLATTFAIVGSQLYATGRNSEYQTGTGNNTEQHSFTLVTTISGVVSDVKAGYFSSCILIDGLIKCAGHNAYGQLGNGSTKSATRYTKILLP